MWRAAVLVLATLTAAPLAAQEMLPPVGVLEVLPEGYPPRIGDITAQLGSRAVAWETYDFSIGAFDASAWIDSFDGIVLKLIGYPPGNPEAEAGRVLIEVRFAAPPAAGDRLAGAPVLIEIYDEGLEGPRLSSKGRTAEVTLDTVTYDSGPGSGYGRIEGRFAARLCARGGKNGPCRRFEGGFATAMQYSGIDRLPGQ